MGSVLLLLGYLAGSGWHLAGYVEHGRGHFGAALAWVLEQDNSDPVRMAGDDNFRLGRYVAFYGPQHPGREIEVVSNREAGRAEWVFVHRLEERHPIEGEMRDTEGNRFRLARAYPAGGPAGWGWFVYRRVR
ncbi:MAG: hypothetical protein U0840_01760 [Gemmataceae bacterium]